MRLAAWVIGGVLVVGAMAPGTAVAEQIEDPEALIRQGIDLRRKGENLRAVGYFMRAYRLAKTPRSAAQLGLVEMAVEQWPESNRYLTEALESDDPWIAKQRPVLEQSREKVRTHLGVAVVSGVPDGTTVRVGSAGAESLPVDRKVWLGPGEVTLVFASGDRAVEKRISVVAGQRTLLTVVLTVAPQPASSAPPPSPERDAAGAVRVETQLARVPTDTSAMPPPTERSTGRTGLSSRMTTAGIVTGSVGGAAVIGGLVCRLISVKKYDAIIHATKDNRWDDSDLDYLTYDRVGTALILGGGVAVAAGATLFVLGRRNSNSEGVTAAALSFGIAPGGVTIGGRF
jgi:hypothetical protein